MKPHRLAISCSGIHDGPDHRPQHVMELDHASTVLFAGVCRLHGLCGHPCAGTQNLCSPGVNAGGDCGRGPVRHEHGLPVSAPLHFDDPGVRCAVRHSVHRSQARPTRPSAGL